MERSVALTKIRKILGPKFNYRVDPRAPNKDEKETRKTELAIWNEKRQVLERAANARRHELLQADAKYQELQSAYLNAREKADKLRGSLHHDKISVGQENGMFNFIKASGDSWEEVIAKLQSKK